MDSNLIETLCLFLNRLMLTIPYVSVMLYCNLDFSPVLKIIGSMSVITQFAKLWNSHFADKFVVLSTLTYNEIAISGIFFLFIYQVIVGYVCPFSVTSNNKSSQFVFLNNQFIFSKIIEAFMSKMWDSINNFLASENPDTPVVTGYPIFVLNLTCYCDCYRGILNENVQIDSRVLTSFLSMLSHLIFQLFLANSESIVKLKCESFFIALTRSLNILWDSSVFLQDSKILSLEASDNVTNNLRSKEILFVESSDIKSIFRQAEIGRRFSSKLVELQTDCDLLLNSIIPTYSIRHNCSIPASQSSFGKSFPATINSKPIFRRILPIHHEVDRANAEPEISSQEIFECFGVVAENTDVENLIGENQFFMNSISIEEMQECFELDFNAHSVLKESKYFNSPCM